MHRGARAPGWDCFSIFVAANGPLDDLASADASAKYDYQITLSVNARLTAGIYGSVFASQGNAAMLYEIENPQKVRNPIALTSIYVPGQPLEITGTVSAMAMAAEEVVNGLSSAHRIFRLGVVRRAKRVRDSRGKCSRSRAAAEHC